MPVAKAAPFPAPKAPVSTHNTTVQGPIMNAPAKPGAEQKSQVRGAQVSPRDPWAPPRVPEAHQETLSLCGQSAPGTPLDTPPEDGTAADPHLQKVMSDAGQRIAQQQAMITNLQ